MNYKVLYRKYRPSNFDEVIGQNTTIELLKESVYNDKISHAYIFSGPRGTGKTSTAKIFTKAINCSCKNQEKPCGQCENCLNFSTSSDVYEIDAASNNGVDQIREIIDNIKLSPINSKYKVYIIDEVHMLSTSAFNALLLTLEEPPSHVVFILATTNIESVPITVLSRCQRMDFKKISNSNITQCIKNVAVKEKIDIEEDAVIEIAEYADGGMRDALSILDQLSKNNEKITQNMVLETIGLVSTKSIIELINALEDNNIEQILEFTSRVRENNIDYKTLVKKLIQIIKKRSVLLKKGEQQSRLSYNDYKNICFELANSLYKSNVHVDSYSLFELILLNYVNDTKDNNTNNVVNSSLTLAQKKEEKTYTNDNNSLDVEKKIDRKLNIDNKNEVLNSKIQDIRINNCFVKANKQNLKESQEFWNKFVNEIKDKNIKGVISDSTCVLSSGDILVIKCPFQSSADKINGIINSIEKQINTELEKNIKLVAVSNERWNFEMDMFKNKMKNNEKYYYIDENNENFDNIFKNSKIEVK